MANPRRLALPHGVLTPAGRHLVGKRIHVVEDSAALTADTLDGFWRELCNRQLLSQRAP
jgi:hypothetical protein